MQKPAETIQEHLQDAMLSVAQAAMLVEDAEYAKELAKIARKLAAQLGDEVEDRRVDDFGIIVKFEEVFGW